MAQKLLIRKSGTQGGIPTTAQLDFGELAVNYRDNKLYFKATDGVTESIVAVEFNPNGAYAKSFALNGNNLEVSDASGNIIDTIDLGAVSPDLTPYQLRSEKGQANGYASLDSNGKIPSSELPAIAIVDVSVVDTIAQRDALTVQTGDFAIVTNNVLDPSQNGSYIYDGTAWQLVQTPGGTVTSVNGETGAVSLNAGDIEYTDTVTDADGNPITITLTVQELGEALDSRIDDLETDVAGNTTLLGLLDTAVNDPSTGLLVTVQGLTTDVGQLLADVGQLQVDILGINATLGDGGTAGAAQSFVATDADGNLIYVAQDAAGSVILSDGDGTFSTFNLTTALGLKANESDVLDSADLAGNILNLRDAGGNLIASVDLSALDNQTAAEVSFNPATSSLTAVNVQNAIEEVNTKADANASAIAALGGGTLPADAFVYTDATGALATVVPTEADQFLKYDGVNYVATNIIDGGSF